MCSRCAFCLDGRLPLNAQRMRVMCVMCLFLVVGSDRGFSCFGGAFRRCLGEHFRAGAEDTLEGTNTVTKWPLNALRMNRIWTTSTPAGPETQIHPHSSSPPVFSLPFFLQHPGYDSIPSSWTDPGLHPCGHHCQTSLVDSSSYVEAALSMAGRVVVRLGLRVRGSPFSLSTMQFQQASR